MTRMVVDPRWVEQLREASGAVEVTSEGEPLGTFIPRQPSLEELMASCPYSEVELNRRAEEALRSPEGREWSAIRKDLEAQWPSR